MDAPATCRHCQDLRIGLQCGMDKPEPQEFALGPSLQLAMLLVAGHVAAALLLATLPLTAGWQFAALLLLAAHCVWVVRGKALRRGGKAPAALRFDSREDVRVSFRDGRMQRGRLLGGSTVSRWLVLLDIRLDSGRRMAVPLMRDALGPGEYRRLRVWLRWGPVARQDTP